MPDFEVLSQLKKEGDDMKILIHLNHGADKSYLLHFDESFAAKRLRSILNAGNQDAMVHKLFRISAQNMEVSPRERKEAEAQADFIVSDGYTAERLA